jgi:predicted GH43/DUF377 family glycosyl hydrolase
LEEIQHVFIEQNFYFNHIAASLQKFEPMLEVKREGILLEPSDLSFENHGVLNPAVVLHEGAINLFYRATNKVNFSTIGRCVLEHPTKISLRFNHPVIIPTEPYESHGIEDPRITPFEDYYLLSYTAYDGHNARGGLMTSKDLNSFHHEGIITPQITYKEFALCMECFRNLNPKYLRFVRLFNKRAGAGSLENMILWDKDVVFFPQRINGKMAMLHRIYPDIQVAYFNHWSELNYTFWKDYLFKIQEHIVLSGKMPFENSYVGAGCPPILTNEGWLLIYHGVTDTALGYVYSTGAALLQANDPTQEIGRLKEPLFSPMETYELNGVTSNVVFPVGAIVLNERLYIYYGAADKRIGVVSVWLKELINSILNP